MQKGKDFDFKSHEFFCPRMSDEQVHLTVLRATRPGDDSGELFPAGAFECSGMNDCGITPKHGRPDWSICPGYAEIMAGKPDDIAEVIPLCTYRRDGFKMDDGEIDNSRIIEFFDDGRVETNGHFDSIDPPHGDGWC